ncbi:hypothetical protein HYS50_03400 [Candidatus Woesearchaeota archaeon]|nr:hypothetical protein [Candidatus Woesearchaeota archaeon]
MINSATARTLCELVSVCPTCKGAGRAYPKDFDTICSHCKGKGTIPLLDSSLVRVTCTRCDGRKRILLGGHAFDYENAISPLVIIRDFNWARDRENAQALVACPECQGRGYTPSTNPWTYVRAVYALQLPVDVVDAMLAALKVEVLASLPFDPGLVAFDVVTKALLETMAEGKAIGIKLS